MGSTSLVIVIIASGILGLVLGYLLSNRRNHNAISQCKELEDKLESSEKVLQKYQSEVADHFSQSATLINELTNSYKKVHEHMVNGVNTLYTKEKVLSNISIGDITPLKQLELPETGTVEPTLKDTESAKTPNEPHYV